jgi:hypothetical protein
MSFVYILCDGFEGGMVYEEESIGACLTEKEAEEWAKAQAEFTLSLLKNQGTDARIERFEAHWEGDWFGWRVRPFRVYFYKKVELKIPAMLDYGIKEGDQAK